MSAGCAHDPAGGSFVRSKVQLHLESRLFGRCGGLPVEQPAIVCAGAVIWRGRCCGSGLAGAQHRRAQVVRGHGAAQPGARCGGSAACGLRRRPPVLRLVRRRVLATGHRGRQPWRRPVRRARARRGGCAPLRLLRCRAQRGAVCDARWGRLAHGDHPGGRDARCATRLRAGRSRRTACSLPGRNNGRRHPCTPHDGRLAAGICR